jgi:hypothetical protein
MFRQNNVVWFPIMGIKLNYFAKREMAVYIFNVGFFDTKNS